MTYKQPQVLPSTQYQCDAVRSLALLQIPVRCAPNHILSALVTDPKQLILNVSMSSCCEVLLIIPRSVPNRELHSDLPPCHVHVSPLSPYSITNVSMLTSLHCAILAFLTLGNTKQATRQSKESTPLLESRLQVGIFVLRGD